MSHLLTQCPYCQTTFKVSEEQMLAANGVVRCGSCMEVFLAGQHRIILKDNVALPEENLESASEMLQEKPEPVIDTYKSPPLFDESDDSDDFDEQENQSPASEAAQQSNVISDESGKDNIDNILDDIDSALDDAFLDDMDNDSPIEIGVVENDVVEEEDVDEIDEADEADEADEEFEQVENFNDNIEPEVPEQELAEAQEERSTLVFSPWDDLVTLDEVSTPDDSVEVESLQENSDTGDTGEQGEKAEAEKTFFMPWQDESAAPENTADFSINQSTDDELPDDVFIADEKEPDDTAAPQIKEQTKKQTRRPISTNYSRYLNPTGYSVKQVSVDSTVPPLNPADSTDTNPDTEHFSDFEIDHEAPDSGVEDPYLETTTGSVIPTLVPDVVATESIPAALNTRALAWFQSLRNTLTGQEKDDHSEEDSKAGIHSHLASLNDEDSLEPIPGENLAAMEEAPVELLNISDKLRHWKVAGMVVTSLVLLSSLAGQYLYYNLDTLIEDSRFDAVTSLACQFIECPDRAVIDLGDLITEELVVRSHPSVENALVVDFIFRNESASEQLFPLAELNFTNIGGEIIANRVFDRSEYLPQEMQLFTHMPAHSSIQVSLELADPGDDATGYALVFRNP